MSIHENNNDNVQTFFDDDDYDFDDLIVVEKSSTTPNSTILSKNQRLKNKNLSLPTPFFLLKTRLVISLGIINFLSLAMLVLPLPEKTADGVAVLFNLTTNPLSIAVML